MNKNTRKIMEELFKVGKGKRAVVKQILNRPRGYQLATYARYCSKKIGRPVTKKEIIYCFNHMLKEGQFSKIVIDNHERVFNYSMVA